MSLQKHYLCVYEMNPGNRPLTEVLYSKYSCLIRAEDMEEFKSKLLRIPEVFGIIKSKYGLKDKPADLENEELRQKYLSRLTVLLGSPYINVRELSSMTIL